MGADGLKKREKEAAEEEVRMRQRATTQEVFGYGTMGMTREGRRRRFKNSTGKVERTME